MARAVSPAETNEPQERHYLGKNHGVAKAIAPGGRKREGHQKNEQKSILAQSRKDAKESRPMDENQIAKILVDCCYRIHKKLGPGLLELEPCDSYL